VFHYGNVLHVFLCCTYCQVSSRRSVPSTNRLKIVAGSKVPRVMKARPSIRARAAATSVGPRAGAPLHTVARTVCPPSSLRRMSARLRLLERRTTARFLHILPRPAGAVSHQLSSESKHRVPALPHGKLNLDSKEVDRRAGRHVRPSETASQMKYLPDDDGRKEFYSKYIRATADDQSKVRHSTRFADAYRSSHSDKEYLEDVSRTFIRRRLSQRRSEDDGGNSASARKLSKMPWHSAVLRRTSDDGIGRFVIRRSQPLSSSAIPESGRTRSADIYSSRYSSPVAMQATQSAAVPSSAASSDYRLVKAEKPDGDEFLLYAALSRSMVGFRWLADRVWHV